MNTLKYGYQEKAVTKRSSEKAGILCLSYRSCV